MSIGKKPDALFVCGEYSSIPVIARTRIIDPGTAKRISDISHFQIYVIRRIDEGVLEISREDDFFIPFNLEVNPVENHLQALWLFLFISY